MSDYEIRARLDGRPTDPQEVATLAADIYKLVHDRGLLIAEGILAGWR
jgi:hypothetical protein